MKIKTFTQMWLQHWTLCFSCEMFLCVYHFSFLVLFESSHLKCHSWESSLAVLRGSRFVTPGLVGQGAVFGRRSVNRSLKVSELLAVRYVSLRMKNTAPNYDEWLIKNQRQSCSSAHVNIETNNSEKHSQSLFHTSLYKIDNMYVHIRTSSAYGRG